MLTVQAVYDMINARAPFDTQAEFDNAGLLVGDPAAEVKGILVAMDVTQAVITEAIACGANLIVTHHPLMFSPIRRLVATDYESRLICRMIRSGIAHIAAHTNLDQAPGGVNDVLAACLGLANVTGEGFVRAGDLPHPMTADELCAHVSASLHTVVRPIGAPSGKIRRVAMCSGGGSDEWPAALAMDAQAFLSGEIKHHHGLAMADAGVMGLEAGHHATEEPGIFALGTALQKELDAVQYDVRVCQSRAGAYAMPE